ncbi:MAG: hypothetical protein SPL00_04905 [Bacilli bacterium]|nr:hypothetical protein [Bacilli bacterium]
MNNKNITIAINLGDYGSTGTIMRNTLEYASKQANFNYLIIVPRESNKSNIYNYKEKKPSLFERIFFHVLLRVNRKNPDGFYEYPYTKRIINKIKQTSKEYDNLIVNLHNLLKMKNKITLMLYIARRNIKELDDLLCYSKV